MRTKITITVNALTSDPELEKRIYLAAEENDLMTIIDLLDFCEDAQAEYIVKEMLDTKKIMSYNH